MERLKRSFSRICLLLPTIILEFVLLSKLMHWFGNRVVWIETVLHIVGAIIILTIVRTARHLSSSIIWIICIAMFPVFGTVTFLLLGADLLISRTFKNITKWTDFARSYYVQDKKVMKELAEKDPDLYGDFHYISKSEGFPFYKNTGFDYYKTGDEGYPVMLEELKKAEKFIFMEYFIIEEGVMWNGILEILEQKAKEGVDVRVMYDDLGSFFTVSGKFASHLEEKGIRCIPFNRINPIIGTILNHRDHRKIMVIDGKVAFSGGVNLADEYINVISPFGHWKENIIRITGQAVWSYTVMFLTHWNALSNVKDEDFAVFKAEPLRGRKDGYIAPYGETPLDLEIVAQNIYMSIINQSKKYCYIMTPYLIIDTDMINTLILAAKRGVDVRIMTPGIPDKKVIWKITRSYYPQLIEGGVKIYEYTPGFVHAKVFVSDDMVATVGTVNLDYRSLYLHFENGTYLYGSKKVLEIRDDYLETIDQCRQMNSSETKNNLLMELVISILRIFAPLM